MPVMGVIVSPSDAARDVRGPLKLAKPVDPLGHLSRTVHLVHQFLFVRAAGRDLPAADVLPLIRHANSEPLPFAEAMARQGATEILAILVAERLALELPSGDWQIIRLAQRENAAIFAGSANLAQWDADFVTVLALVDENNALDEMLPETWGAALDSIANERITR